MTITVDAMYIKKINKKLVLNTIRKHAPVSRAGISKITGLNKGTVSSLVAELMGDDYVYETGAGKSSGGRRPIMLMFNNQCGYSIGIDVGVNYLSGILTDLIGHVVAKEEFSLDSSDYETIKQKMFQMIDSLISDTPASTYRNVGIGVSIPGVVNNEGVVLFAPNLGWENINLKDDLQEKYDLPVTIENEANAGAYGELKFGKNKPVESMIFISAGMGIGSGVIINDTLYKGVNGFSGEVGHMNIKNDGDPCPCGKHGCWELYASEKAAVNKAKKVYEKEITFSELIEMGNNNDEKAIAVFQEIGEELGVGIANIINIFNPNSLVIGNRMASAKKWIEEPLNNTIKAKSLPFHQKDLDIHISSLDLYSIPLGVSYLIIEDFLEK